MSINVQREGSKAQPAISVTAQQSRFHTDASENGGVKEISVKDLSISIGERELLSHTELTLQPGRHYVLVGRNGTGKSTLLQAIGTGLVPGIPQSLRVLVLGQVQDHADESNATADGDRTTVLQHVVRSDKRRERLLSESRSLSEASKQISDPLALVHVYRQLSRQRLEIHVSEARLIAARRSGARGLKARKELQKLEAELATMTTQLADMSVSETPDLAMETQSALDLLSEVELALEDMGAAAAEGKARSVLLGLGFSPDSLDKPKDELSGGWQTRCMMACSLCQQADLLLLDEPTNFLDLPSIIWLENYIKDLGLDTTVVVVTHDRMFADGVADELLVLREQKLERFRGNVSAYEINRLKTYKYLYRMAETQDKQKKQMQSAIASTVRAAKRAGDDKKLKQAASRSKKLEERVGMQVNAKGTRFKLNRDMAGFHNSVRSEIDIPTFDPPARMVITTTPSDLRFPGALLSFEKVSFVYPRAKIPTLSNIDLTIHQGDRVGLAGLNGSGKSTLTSLAMEATERGRTLQPSRGTVSRHTRARFGVYSQTAVEELSELSQSEPKLTALAHLMAFAGPSCSEQDARAILSGLGLAPKAQAEVPLSLLSGGQKVRLALAKVLWNPPHLLILDEVTTHLDSDSIQALAIELRKYQGALLVITHDRFFMRCVVEGESPKTIAVQGRGDAEEDVEDESGSEEDESKRPGVVYRLSKGKLKKLDGGMMQYEEIAARTSAKMGKG